MVKMDAIWIQMTDKGWEKKTIRESKYIATENEGNKRTEVCWGGSSVDFLQPRLLYGLAEQ